MGEWCNQHPEDQITKKRMNKTIMNMIRLYLTVFDILEKGEIITNRAENHDLLMMARNGEFQATNGYIKHDIKDFHKEYENACSTIRRTLLCRTPSIETVSTS